MCRNASKYPLQAYAMQPSRVWWLYWDWSRLYLPAMQKSLPSKLLLAWKFIYGGCWPAQSLAPNIRMLVQRAQEQNRKVGSSGQIRHKISSQVSLVISYYDCRYILPCLSRIPNDDEEWIRIAYAAAVGPLSSAAYGFLSSIQNSGNSSEALVSWFSLQILQRIRSISCWKSDVLYGDCRNPAWDSMSQGSSKISSSKHEW